jgi:mRNA deadenylase 3'-5' endonuclease subunit Ccr4
VSFAIVTYNVLAAAYVKAERYPLVAAELLEPRRRRAALVDRVVALDADVLCAQEVEPDLFAELARRFAPLGVHGTYAQKRGGKPDGCATFVRRDLFAEWLPSTLAYADGSGAERDSGHVALVVALTHDGRRVAIANTHVKWDPPDCALEDRWGQRQLTQLLSRRETLAPNATNASTEWIVCGDFNILPDSTVLCSLRDAGFADAHAATGGARAHTCVTEGRAQTVDYVWCTTGLRASPLDLPGAPADAPLPSANEPSDHVPIGARIEII